MGNINADYYYGVEAEQFSFYRMPKLLITDERFKYLSNDAKLLYGLMLDRMSLSMRNRWLDDKNRVYIIYTAEEVMCDMNCSNNKCAKILAELDSKKGIGLIERHKRGLGKPDIIYVKNFITLKEETSSDSNHVDIKKEKNVFIEDESMDVEFSEMQNSNLQTWEKSISGDGKNTSQEMRKTHTNNTNINNTDINVYNPINLINQEEQLKENRKKNSGNLSNKYTEKNKYQGQIFKNNIIDDVFCQNNTDNEDKVEKAAQYMQLVQQNIEYDTYIQDPNGERFDEIYNLICDVINAECKSIRIGGVYYPHELVKARFLKLNAGHVKYVMYAIDNVHEKVHNIRSYMIAALYNAPCTMNHCYDNDVNTTFGY